MLLQATSGLITIFRALHLAMRMSRATRRDSLHAIPRTSNGWTSTTLCTAARQSCVSLSNFLRLVSGLFGICCVRAV